MLPVSHNEIMYKALSLCVWYFTKSPQRVKQAFIDEENDSQKKRDMVGHMVQLGQIQNQKQLFWLPNLCFFPYSKFLHQKSILKNSTSLHATLLQHILLQGRRPLEFQSQLRHRGLSWWVGSPTLSLLRSSQHFFITYHVLVMNYTLQLSCKLKMP